MSKTSKYVKSHKRNVENPNFFKNVGNRQEIDLKKVTIDYQFKNKAKQDSLEKHLKQVGVKIKSPASLRSKKKQNVVKEEEQPITNDLNPKAMQKKYQRPYFSPIFNSYEADLAFITTNEKFRQSIYLFLVNINTRYLYILQLTDKETSTLKHSFEKLIFYGLRINSIRFDGECGLNSKSMLKYFEDNDIKVYSNSSAYINKNRIVDRVIRTIRDMYETYLRKNKIDFKKITLTKEENILQQLVTIYNNTYHRSIGKAPSQMTYEDELKYIQSKQKQIKELVKKNISRELIIFEYGDPLLIYLDNSKTNSVFEKRRGNYNIEATFIQYENGNIVCEVNGDYITIPYYHAILDKNKLQL